MQLTSEEINELEETQETSVIALDGMKNDAVESQYLNVVVY